MNPFPEYLTAQLKEKLLQRQVVVWYDANQEFAPFVDDLAGEEAAVPFSSITVEDLPAKLATYRGSYFALRREVEPEVAGTRPAPLLIYVGGQQRDREGSVLMELECAGTCYEPQLKRLARNVMRKFYSDGVIDEMLSADSLNYGDILALLESGGRLDQAGSMLKIVFGSVSDNVALISKWLASPELDKTIEQKSAREELAKLVQSRAGFVFDQDGELADCRDKLARYLLVNEFRDDLKCTAPTSVSLVPKPSAKEQQEFSRSVLDHLRDRSGLEFEQFADAAEAELGLVQAEIAPEHLGSIDTFRFEERAMLMHCADLIAAENYKEAEKLVSVHSKSFWARHDISRRQAQWEVIELLTKLGIQVERVDAAVTKLNGSTSKSSTKLVGTYAAPDGWHLLDLTHRRVESRVAQMDEEPDSEEALTVMQSRVENVLRKMAETFSKAFQAEDWSVSSEVLSQTNIYPAKVKELPGKVAWFHVDSLRFEMGVELKRLLPEVEDAELVPAIATLPSITPLCMAALLPGAAASYSVVDHQGKAAAKIGDSVLKDLAARMKYLRAEIPDSTDISLERLLQDSTSKVLEKLREVRLVVVRSQDIDALGEKNELLARHLMDTLIGNIARAARRLAKLGFERFVITSDHGHQFGSRKDDDMKIAKPGGAELEAHRRCWIGKGGQTSTGTVRITAAEMGYDSDLEFVFPTDLGVFKTGGGLAYHHGGFSLQELVIPVLSFRLPCSEGVASAGPPVGLMDVPDTITNRTIGVRVEVEADLVATEPLRLRISMVSQGVEAGKAGMAIEGDFDAETGVLALNAGKSAHVAMVLSREDFDVVKIVVQDAETGSVLTESKGIPVQLKL